MRHICTRYTPFTVLSPNRPLTMDIFLPSQSPRAPFPPSSSSMRTPAWPFSGPAFLTILLSQQVFPASTSLLSGTCGRARAVLRPRGIVLPQFAHRKLAGNDLSDMRRGKSREKGKKQQQNQGLDVAPALNHTLNRYVNGPL